MVQNDPYNLIEYTGGDRYIMTDGLSDNTYEIETLPPDSREWFIWLASLGSFTFKGKEGHFAARLEEKMQDNAPSMFSWYAYRKANGRGHKLYLGKTSELTLEMLEEIAGRLHTAVLSSMPKDTVPSK
jgi:hypothetical protein